MNDFQSLISQFAQLDGARLGCGPKHPDSNPGRVTKMNAEIDELYKQYPGASFDEDYQKFLYYYGGGLIKREGLLLDIWGPDLDLTNDLVWEDVLFDWNYYCPFCCIRSNDYGRIDYGFAKHQTGVFQATNLPKNEIRTLRYCNSFSEWLGLVVTDVNQVLK